MRRTLFEYPLDLPSAWEDGTTYTLFLRTDDAKATPAAAVRLMADASGERYRANLVLTRDRQDGRDLAKYAAEQKEAIAKRLPSAKLVCEGPSSLGGLPAHEQEYQVALDRPLPTVSQWHASLVRDGWCYHFCGTTTKERFEKDKKEFRALVERWCTAKA